MKNIKVFQKDLVSWFEKNKRDLPWRKNKDAYKIWVSEVMLQQTKVDTVIPYFENFMKKFPTLESLANAEEQEVLKAWEGLGYYSRARNLQEGARQVVESFNGKVPNTLEQIKTIRGIGPYTSGAILSIAYGITEPAVDGNVMRVMSRVLSIWDDIAKAKTRKQFEEKLYKIIDPKNTSSFNQGLMELGALICTPTNPKCLECPVRSNCQAFDEKVQSELPVKSKKKPPKEVSMVAIVLKDKNGDILVRKRPDTGLLANLWEFPNIEVSPEQSVEEQIKNHVENLYGLKLEIGEKIMDLQHIFSHIKWEIEVFEGKFTGNVTNSDMIKILSIDDAKKLPFPVSHQKILQKSKSE